MPLTLPQLALPCLDLVLRCAVRWRLAAGVAFSGPPVGALTGYNEIPDLPTGVDGTSPPLPPACHFPLCQALTTGAEYGYGASVSGLCSAPRTPR